MGISLYKIKKWYKMLTGNSIAHVNQGIGTCYSKTEIAGYYNDLTEKITKDDPNILVPKYYVDTGEKVYFSIGIFQYGLAAYDLFLKSNETIYKDKLLACAEWAINNQQKDGSWVTFPFENTLHPYSSMAQGEGISLLIRAHIVTGEIKYLNAASKAKEFMLIPIEKGGTTKYTDKNIFFYEYTHQPLILNGWIFSIWGIYDFYRYTSDKDTKQILDASLISLQRKLPDFDIKYWSKYDEGNRICSLFYHKLHVAQLMVMYDLFGSDIYREFAEKWNKYLNSKWKRARAFIKKAFQKVFERSPK